MIQALNRHLWLGALEIQEKWHWQLLHKPRVYIIQTNEKKKKKKDVQV